MIQGTVIRGTTPVHKFELTQPQDGLQDIKIIYGQKGKALFSKTLSDCKIVDNKIQVSLMQEETLLLNPNKLLEVEIIFILKDGQVIGSATPYTYRVIHSMNEEIFD